MPNIKCTAKLAKRAGLRPASAAEETPDDWHANIFTFDRRFYVIFVHDHSRLTCVAGPVKKRNLQDLGSLLSKALASVLEHEGFSNVAKEYALSKIGSMTITKTDNRSVLGTINDNIFHIDVHAHHAGGINAMGLTHLAAKVNHMPMNPLKWKYAIEEYRQGIIHGIT